MNQFIHPRNPFKHAPPDFADLAIRYDECKQYFLHTDAAGKGKTRVDFANSDAVRALTRTLLMEYHKLDVDIPVGALIPTLTLRLNYVLYLEDVLYAFSVTDQRPTKRSSTAMFSNLKQSSAPADTPVSTVCAGIDLGCGSTCIYPLLACSMNNSWRMIGTESFKQSYEVACRNVRRNSMDQKIEVVFTDSVDTVAVVEASRSGFFPAGVAPDFTMCNPPFFSTYDEEQERRKRKICDISRCKSNRKRKLTNNSISSGKNPTAFETSPVALPAESVISGGEIAFVQQMIRTAAATDPRCRVKIYSSLLGVKNSVMAVLEYAERAGASAIFTEFCQGRTMRWCILWSWRYDLNLVPFSQPRTKFRNQIQPVITRDVALRMPPNSQAADEWDWKSVAFDAAVERFIEIMKELKLYFSQESWPDEATHCSSESGLNCIVPVMNGVQVIKFFVVDKRERSLKKSRQRAAHKLRLANDIADGEIIASEIEADSAPGADACPPSSCAYLHLLVYVMRSTMVAGSDDEDAHSHMLDPDAFTIKAKVLSCEQSTSSHAVALMDSIVSRLIR